MMTKTISRYFITVVFISLALCALLSTVIIYSNNVKTKENEMQHVLKLIEYSLDYSQDINKQINKLNPLVYNDDSRITIIDEQGNILGDSYNDKLENHQNRKEFKEALQNEFGFSQRLSETTRKNTLYVAYYHNHHIIRISVPYDALTEYFHSMIPTLSISIIISLIIAYFLSRKLAYRISKPILEIGEGIDNMKENFRFELKEYEYDEFNIIVDTIHNLSHKLRKSMKEVGYEREKMNEILKQMSEGFILLDDKNRVISINQKAIELLGDIQIHDDLIKNLSFPTLIETLKLKASEQYIELKVNHCIYACYVSRMTLGTTLFFVDITASKKSEKMRSEFFSNVSHELKTPMTSIKGYSELLSQGFITNEQQKDIIIKKIDNEVDHMAGLINDILMLSRLENEESQVEMITLKIKEMTMEVLESHETEIKRSHITIDTDFKEVEFIGDHFQIYTLLNNLIGNAIKYNKQDGEIWIDIILENKVLKIKVKDTGIGIPKKDQTRIFERFYRVDKGRSRQLGGTGLGLAIVKHIVNLYKGTIHLESELNQGTTITIVLPINE